MATLKERLNRKNSLGGYDTIYLETSSDLIKRPDGSTVESALVTVNNKVTELNTTVENVTTNVTQQVQTIIQQGNAKHASSHASDGADPITPASIGALASGGTAAAATKLATARTFQVNLGSTSSASFNGTANVTPGVTGALGLGNGGTGKTTAPLGLYNLINGCTAITNTSVVDTDVIAIGDVSAATAKKITIADLKNVFGVGDGGVGGVGKIPTTPGQVCNWAGYNWTVVHVTSNLIYMILTNIYSMTTFGSNTRYSQSNLISLCTNFYNTFGDEYKSVLADVTVNGVTQKVFVPAHGMVCNNSPAPYNGDGTNNYQASSMCGDGTSKYPVFSWFSAEYGTAWPNRVATYNGSAQHWWTSTACHSGSVWYVYASGGANHYRLPSDSYGFRPCVAIKRK